MSEIRTVTCDGCGRDCTGSDDEHAYRLTLGAELRAGFTTALSATHPLRNGPHHFCKLECLDRWREKCPRP